MTTASKDLWAKAEHHRRRFERLLPEGLYVRIIEARPLARTPWGTRGRLVEVEGFGLSRVRPSVLIHVLANRLCGVDLWGMLCGTWVCSLRWDVGEAPSEREFREAVAEGLARAEREFRAGERVRRRAMWAWGFDFIRPWDDPDQPDSLADLAAEVAS